MMCGTGPRLDAYTMRSIFLISWLVFGPNLSSGSVLQTQTFHRSVMSVHRSLGQSTLGQTSVVGSFLASCTLLSTFDRTACQKESLRVWLIQVCSYTSKYVIFRVMCESRELAGKLVCGWVGSSVKSKIWPITFVWIGNVNLLGLSRHELEWLVRTHDQKLVFLLSAPCQSTLLSPCEADGK